MEPVPPTRATKLDVSRGELGARDRRLPFTTRRLLLMSRAGLWIPLAACLKGETVSGVHTSVTSHETRLIPSHHLTASKRLPLPPRPRSSIPEPRGSAQRRPSHLIEGQSATLVATMPFSHGLVVPSRVNVIIVPVWKQLLYGEDPPTANFLISECTEQTTVVTSRRTGDGLRGLLPAAAGSGCSFVLIIRGRSAAWLQPRQQ